MNTSQTAQTSVQEIDLDIDSLFNGGVGEGNLITPAPGTLEGTKKPGIFSNAQMDMSFLNPDAKEEKSDEELGIPKDKDKDVPRGTVKEGENEESLKELLDLVDETFEEEQNTSGKKRTDKSALVDTMSKLIEEGLIIPFEDEKSMEDYSTKDWKELLEANFEEREKAIRQETPQQFFESLPEELQYAAKYVADGGQDLKGLFRALAHVEEYREMSPEDPNDQEFIVRSYLRVAGFGNDSEIDEEITTWKDLGKLEQQAKKFKPKLDAMQEQVVQEQLSRQETMREQQEEAAQTYVGNVYEALKTSELNGIRLDKKTQAYLYTGLVQPQYPSISGKPTNLLGHLLERYQYVEPNYPLIAEALWLLSDPDSYRSTLKRAGSNEKVEDTVRKLKTEQSNKIASSVSDYEEQGSQQRKIPRSTNIFKR